MDWVISVLTVLTVVTGVLMTFLILLQEGKGGGLAALGGTKAAGVEGVTNPVRRATAYLAVIFFVMLVTLGVMHKPKHMDNLFNTASAGAGAKKEEVKTPEVPVAPAPEAPKTVELPKTTGVQPVETVAPKAAPTDTKPAEAPKTDAPKVEAPKTEAPKAEEAKK